MSIATYDAAGRLVGFTIEDTVSYLLPPVPEPVPDRSREETRRLGIPHRRPKADPSLFEQRRRIPRSIGVVGEPLLTTELPALVEYSLRPRKPEYVGRHHQPSWFARLREWIGVRR
jgi:hypothetical protein